MRLTRRAVIAAALAPVPALAQARAPRVFAAGQPAAVLVQALRPDALLGWPRALPTGAAQWLGSQASRLPVTGELNAAGQTANLEALVALRPDLILDYGAPGPRYQEAAESVRRRTGLPYILIDGALDRTPEALLQAGELLGAHPRAAALAGYARAFLQNWRANRSRPAPTFYYGRSPDGLEAGLPGSLSTEVLEGAGWRNVARSGAARGLARVSLEQVLALDPEVVVTLDPAFAALAMRDPRWRRRRRGGVRRVALLPQLPFGWLDRPPSLNRLLGCLWVASDVARGGDIRGLAHQIRDFHGLFYGRSSSAAQALAWARSSLPT